MSRFGGWLVRGLMWGRLEEDIVEALSLEVIQ